MTTTVFSEWFHPAAILVLCLGLASLRRQIGQLRDELADARLERQSQDERHYRLRDQVLFLGSDVETQKQAIKAQDERISFLLREACQVEQRHNREDEAAKKAAPASEMKTSFNDRRPQLEAVS